MLSLEKEPSELSFYVSNRVGEIPTHGFKIIQTDRINNPANNVSKVKSAKSSIDNDLLEYGSCNMT